MIKTILLVLAAAMAALLVYAATKPDTFAIERSVLIKAPPGKIYPLISDLKAFNTWNPFLAQDPAAKLSYEATTAGLGAGYAWNGDKSGAGSMKVSEATEPSKVAMQLHFTKPMEGHNLVVFSLKPQGEATQVTWAMSGPMPYVSKLMTTFMSMDKMVGGAFETGLASLKALAEKA
jgi:uncharacterized protein YndB with AHSA1/START domain